MQNRKKCMQVYDLPGKIRQFQGLILPLLPSPRLFPGKLNRGVSHKGTSWGVGTKEKQETPRHNSVGQAAGTDPAALRHSKAKELDCDLAPSPITNSCKVHWGLARPLSLTMMSSLNAANFLQGFGFPSEIS